MKSFSSLLIGEQSLLVQCGEQWLAKGHRIVAVVASNDSVKAWCSGHSILQFNDLASLEASDFLQQVQPDYLFSISNLKILPLELLKAPLQMAINFHDGPLPAYAGLNTPVWALMNGESEHGVTFHEMAPEVDLGDILVQRKFPLVDSDTAFTLNGRCYQEGLEAFTDLIDLLGHRSAMSIAQNHSQRSYYAAKKRPTAAACIDWQHPAKDIQRFVRALDFGGYRNPLLLPKIWLGLGGLIVREAHCKEFDQAEKNRLQLSAATGTVLAINKESITVRAIDAVLEFSRVSDFAGAAISPLDACSKAGIAVGSVLPAMDPDIKADIDDVVDRICLYESMWSDRLQKAEPVATPFAQLSGDVARASKDTWEDIDCELPDWVEPHVAIATLAMLFARLSGKNLFTLAFQNTAAVPTDSTIAAFFETWLPLPVNYEPGATFTSFCEAVQQAIPARELASGFLKDLYAREPRLDAGKSVSLYPIKIRVLDAGNQVGDLAGKYPVEVEGQNSLLIDIPVSGGKMQLRYCPQVLSKKEVSKISGLFLQLLGQLKLSTDRDIGRYTMLVEEDAAKISSWNNTGFSYDRSQCVHRLIEQQVAQSPDVMACRFENQRISFHELNQRANQLARLLVDEGVCVGDLVGIMLNRSINMLVALIAVHKAGAAYVPLDPVYPRARLQYMVEDSGLKVLLQEEATDGIALCSNAKALCIEQQAARLAAYPGGNLNRAVGADALAYVIYTSGSTGKPKGVMVEHGSVVNFFVGMDQRIEPGPGVWLAVTSISFDISVLELFWTLARGFTVLLYADALRQKTSNTPAALEVAGSQFASRPARHMHNEAAAPALEFGLFYWNVATEESEYDNDKYKLLLDSARYADQHGFNAVWTPERHFASFGGLYPNPSVTSAALATITTHVALRAGSCVVPLHSPIRIAEEWSVVDNLSRGRVGISIAAGWAPPDFAIKPENFDDAKNIMFESAQQVQKLWRGETLEFPGPNGSIKVRTLPRPIQNELPLWVTTAGNIDSFKRAGEIGANVLTHLLGQTIEEVAGKVKAYREAWQKAGHGGRGVITVMLHTFAGPDQQQVEGLVREPMKNYLKSAMFLVKSAAWQFPAFKQLSEEQGKTLDSFFETISEQDMDDLLEFAFQRYFSASGLFGTPEHCQQIVDQVYEADCDEIACLIDFGVDTETVLEHLPYLNRVRELAQSRLPARAAQTAMHKAVADETKMQGAVNQSDFSLQALLNHNEVTHLQCTPSMATMLAADDGVRPGLAKLKQMMVGGEAFPPALAKELGELVEGRVSNMYGPT
ncbi:MAG: LLM class flavin-dependent oxidoreductase, partial [Gammaproteobacteria bacterium]|nr:LLM class flavin-dependent oxidoreductase [Gammaproteobacteria bacterium]